MLRLVNFYCTVKFVSELNDASIQKKKKKNCEINKTGENRIEQNRIEENST